MSLMASQFMLPYHKRSLGEGSAAAVSKLQTWERSFSCPLALVQRQLTSLWLWKQHREMKSWRHKPQQIALQAKERTGHWRHMKV